MEPLQYYDPNSQTPQPIAPTTHPRKRWLWIGVVTALIVAVAIPFGLYVFNRWQLHRDANNTAQTRQQVEEEIAQESQNCGDDEACLARARTQAAQDAGLVAACKGLVDQPYANCVMLIAQDSMDAQACDALSGDDRAECQDSVALLVAKDKQDYRLCKNIADDETRTSCEAQLLIYVLEENACATYGVDQAVCDSQAKLDAIIVAGDPAGCTTLVSPYRETCDDLFTSLDQDGDGLVLATEHVHGTSDLTADTDGDGLTDGDEVGVHTTDPRDADTDDDGFEDGVEVKNGYNPKS